MIYNPYLLRVELDALKAHALYHEQRGRNLASFRTHVEVAEAHLDSSATLSLVESSVLTAESSPVWLCRVV